jgi:DNA-binding NtrC family response regulator
VLEILLVDDSEQDLKLVERNIRQCKITNPVRTFRSGQELLALFERAAGERYLVFIDGIMKPLSGLETLRRVKDKGLAPDSIFVLVSGMKDLKRIKECYQLGARTFVIKPLNCEDIMEIFHSLKPLLSFKSEGVGHSLVWLNPPKQSVTSNR